MIRRRNKESVGEPDWEGARSELAKWAGTPKETPLEKFIREEIKMITAILERGYSCSEIAAWLVEKKVPGAYSKSVSAAIKKVQESGGNSQNSEHLFAELVSEFLLKELLVNEIDVDQAYLLKGKEACKIVVGLETKHDGRIQFQIFGDEEEKIHTAKAEGMVKNLRGPIQMEDLNMIAAKLAKCY